MSPGSQSAHAELSSADLAERHALASLAGPIISKIVTGNHQAAQYHTWVIALHEAAHAAVATALGIRLKEVSIVPDSESLGHCTYRRIYNTEPSSKPVSHSDSWSAVRMTWLSLSLDEPRGWREVRRHLRHLRQRSRDLVLVEWYPIHRLAGVLRERSTLTGEEAEAILDAARHELASHMPAAPTTPDGAGGSVEGAEYANSAVA
jgi:hypothetical protein